MDIPAFSIFSAISEIFVTIGVLYAIFTTLAGKPFPKVLLGGVFEHGYGRLPPLPLKKKEPPAS